MKKTLTLIAILISLHTFAFDSTMLTKSRTSFCCKKHKKKVENINKFYFDSVVTLDSATISNCKLKRQKKRKAIKRSMIMASAWTIGFFVVRSGVLIK